MEFFETAYRYLKLNKIPVDKLFLQQRMLSHPDYPSMVSLTDTFDELRLKYEALIVEKEKLHVLSYPIIIHTSAGDGDFKIIRSPDVIQENTGISKSWDGVVFKTKKGTNIINQAHALNLKETERSRNLLVFIILGFVLLWLTLSFIHFNPVAFSLSLLSMTGIFICSLIILHSLGKDNAIIKQLCKNDGTSGCNKILDSGISRVFKGAGLGDIGLVYFISLFFYLFFSTLNNSSPAVLAILAVPLSLSFVFSLFSLWYQWRIAKAWCKMCLITLAIIWIQAGVLGMGFINNNTSLTAASINLENFYTSFLSLLVGSVWLLVRPFILKAESMKKEVIKSLKWQRNPDVFLSLLYNQRQVNAETSENDITLGNPDAAIKIMVGCNPYCGPCAKAHDQLHELLEIYPGDISITVRFTVNVENISDQRSIAVVHILNACRNEKYKSDIILKDWFKWMNLEKWKMFYPVNASIENFQEQLKQHQAWCEKSDIKYTPAIFINGYEMPENYNAGDLKLLIPAVSEMITPLTASAQAV